MVKKEVSESEKSPFQRDASKNLRICLVVRPGLTERDEVEALGKFRFVGSKFS